MATKADEFKAAQLAKHAGKRSQKAKAKAKVRKAHVAKAKSDHTTHATHNQAERAAGGSAYALEAGSRKSSRTSGNRAKSDSSLRKTNTVKTRSPEERSQRVKEGGRPR